ncbi:unnamed protein product [Rotaria magnacalcarata]|uniref:Uncharacterized protein n=3 Tax=Rotaria magnacalcarata TaxID=392030 RepID=A0A816FNW1_9BILA|nr:unnamed protein product [Rotaria magnacalcarata]CAF5069290.1 unnamed protein product [Rotaria magnacalcarata]
MMNVQLQYHCSMIIVNINGKFILSNETITNLFIILDERSSSISMVNERPTSISLIDIPRWHISQLRNLAKWMFSSERQIYGIGAH